MADRRSFLGAVSGVAASVLLAAQAEAQAPAPVAPSGSPLPSPAPSASPKPRLGAGAVAFAVSMRRFDPGLCDKDVDTIAHASTTTAAARRGLNPRKATALKNADEPVTRFAAPRPAR